MTQAQGNATPKFLTVQPTEQGLAFILGNGKQLTFDVSKAPEAVQEQAKLHGFNQKIRDSAAGFSKGSDFAGAFAEMADVIESLYAGEWNRRGGVAGAKMEDLAQAVAKLKKVDVDTARAAVAKMTAEKRTEISKHPKVALILAELAKARLTAAAKDSEELEIEL